MMDVQQHSGSAQTRTESAREFEELLDKKQIETKFYKLTHLMWSSDSAGFNCGRKKFSISLFVLDRLGGNGCRGWVA